MTCQGCNAKRMGHYGDWCNCTNPEFSLISVEFEKELSKMDFSGIGKLLIP